MAVATAPPAAQTLTCKRLSDGRAEDYRHSDASRCAAVLGALGFPISTSKAWLDEEGVERVTYHHGSLSLDPQRPGLTNAKDLVNLWRSGKMEAADPYHPFLDGLRAIDILQAIERWIVTGQAHRLQLAISNRFELVPGLDRAVPSRGVIATRHMHRAVALCLLGYDLLRIESPAAGSYTFSFLQRSLGVGMADTAESLIGRHRDGKLSPIHVFCHAFDVAETWHRLMRLCADEMVKLYMKSKKTHRHATYYADTSKEIEDRSHRFLSGRFL